jgi:mannosyltransferase OCH1-like enzyme
LPAYDEDQFMQFHAHIAPDGWLSLEFTDEQPTRETMQAYRCSWRDGKWWHKSSNAGWAAKDLAELASALGCMRY